MRSGSHRRRALSGSRSVVLFPLENLTGKGVQLDFIFEIAVAELGLVDPPAVVLVQLQLFEYGLRQALTEDIPHRLFGEGGPWAAGKESAWVQVWEQASGRALRRVWEQAWNRGLRWESARVWPPFRT